MPEGKALVMSYGSIAMTDSCMCAGIVQTGLKKKMGEQIERGILLKVLSTQTILYLSEEPRVGGK